MRVMSLHELIDVVGRLHDPFERVAADAIDELQLVVVAAGRAHHPFGVGELLAQVAGLAQLEIGGGGGRRRPLRYRRRRVRSRPRGSRSCRRRVDSRAAGKAKWPCSLVMTLTVMLEPSRLALTITPSIAPFLGRGDGSGECLRVLRAGGRRTDRLHEQQRQSAAVAVREQASHQHGGLPVAFGHLACGRRTAPGGNWREA